MKIKITEHNIPYESKRDSKCPYWYIFKHGIGPGAVPDDVKIGKVKDLDNYYCIVWIDRPLSDEELKYYDIYPETMNNSILKNRLGYSEEEIDAITERPSIKPYKANNIISLFDENKNTMFKEGNDTVYTIIKKDWSKKRNTEFSGTLSELIQKFSYTLETGKSWQNEKGNKKINTAPKNIKSFITNLNNAVNNSALNGSSNISYELKEETINENTAIRHHIDNGYSIARVDTNPIRINDLTLTIDKDIYEMEDSFWFDEEDNDNTGWGGVEFFGTARLTDDFDNYVDFKWWFNVSLVGDEYDENKIYIEIDNSLIASDLFTYEVEVENGLDEDAIYDNDYDIGEAIYTIIENNCDLFGYSKY